MIANQQTARGLKSSRDTLVTQIPAAHRHRHPRRGVKGDANVEGFAGMSGGPFGFTAGEQMIPP